jgi:hypothetical protein
MIRSGICQVSRHLPSDANRLLDLPRLTSPTPHGISGSQSGHHHLNQFSIEFHDLACPAGVEPATYGLEGLTNLQRQCSTMVYSALVLGVHFCSDLLGLDGVRCRGHGIRRCLSGKPTFTNKKLSFLL